MSNIETIVDSLENRITKVLNKLESLEQTNAKLKDDVVVSQNKIYKQEELIGSWKEKNEKLKLANSILGRNESKKETKLKINALIREIDYCVSQLSE